jgi:hypothetical protein
MNVWEKAIVELLWPTLEKRMRELVGFTAAEIAAAGAQSEHGACGGCTLTSILGAVAFSEQARMPIRIVLACGPHAVANLDGLLASAGAISVTVDADGNHVVSTPAAGDA